MAGLAESKSDRTCWSAPELIITIVGVLSGVALGAWICWLASGRNRAPLRITPQYLPPVPSPPMLSRSPPALPAPDLAPVVAQIRALIRAANSGSDPGAADQARQLLDDTEHTYGSALSAVCSPSKLRSLIDRVQARQPA
jgi:hypothetical protein